MLASSIPGITDGGDAAVIAITIAIDAAAVAPCADPAGVTLSVTGHAEASVSYMGASWPTDPKVASTASSVGVRAFIGGMDSSVTKADVTGAKSGCSVKLATAAQTGSFALVAGAITIGTATVTN